MIHEADKSLKSKWRWRFDQLPIEAKLQLHGALMDLRSDALVRAQHCWSKHKAPMALYWKVIGVYSGHLARAIKVSPLDVVKAKHGEEEKLLEATKEQNKALDTLIKKLGK